MSSATPSGSQSETSNVQYPTERRTLLYKMQMVEGLKRINEDLTQIDKNMKSLAEKSGPFKSQLSSLLASLPAPNLDFINMETE